MFNLRGSREFVEPVASEALGRAIDSELHILAATDIRREGERFVVGALNVNQSRSPTFVLENLAIVPDHSSPPGRLSYEAQVHVKYPSTYLSLWLVPCILAIGFGVTVSPYLVLLLPLAAWLVQFSYPMLLRIWFEEFAHKLERKALALQAQSGA
jgi:hypothetical protein